jgi:hypothetical protein
MHTALFFSFFHTRTHTFYICVHYIEVFFAEGTKKSVHCSELGGVHYIEVRLQQKSIGGTEICVQIGGVHYIEVFTNGGFTVILIKRKFCWFFFS